VPTKLAAVEGAAARGAEYPSSTPPPTPPNEAITHTSTAAVAHIARKVIFGNCIQDHYTAFVNDSITAVRTPKQPLNLNYQLHCVNAFAFGKQYCCVGIPPRSRPNIALNPVNSICIYDLYTTAHFRIGLVHLRVDCGARTAAI
ncbi:hypothetical protein TSMEX_002066, partial [Taenia solium]